MPDTMPRQVAHRSDVGLAVTSAAAMITAGAYFTGYLGWHNAIMLYLAFLTVATVCGVNSAMARCHLTIANAFTAGVAVGRSQPHHVPTPRQDSRPGLRVVD